MSFGANIFKNFKKTMRIIAETNDLEPPYPSANATFRLQLNEDQVLPLGAAELEYFDDFSGPEDVTFEIIKSCHCVKCNRLGIHVPSGPSGPRTTWSDFLKFLLPWS